MLGGGAWLLSRGGAPAPAPSPPPLLACRFQPGDALAFRLHATSDSGAGAGGQHLEVHAVMHWRVLAARGTGWRVAVALDDVTLEEQPEPALPGAQAALAEPFLLDVARDCRFLGLAFGPRAEAGAIGRLESLVQSLEVVLPVMPVARWTARQEDAIGDYVGHYAQESAGPAGAAGITRRRARYTRSRLPSPGAALGGGPQVKILGSQARATLDGSGRWLRELASEDHLEVSMGDRLLAEVRGQVRLERLERPGLARLSGLAANHFVWGNHQGPRPVRLAPGRPDPELAALDLRGALADFQRILGEKKGHHTAVNRLAAYLAAHPAAIAELMAELRSGRIDPGVRAPLFLALELAGTPQAELALAEAVGDPRHTEIDRMRAAAALADVAQPSARAFEALAAEARRTPASGESHDGASTALLALGTLGHNAAASQPELTGRVRQELEARLARGSTGAELTIALDAAGNAGDPALAPALERYLDHPSPQVRAHAAGGFRRFKDTTGEASLLARLERDTAAPVRLAIAEALAERARAGGGYLSPALLAAAIRRLSEEPDARVRAVLIGLLGGATASAPEAKQALIRQFHRETQPELQQLIGRFCSADELG